MLSAQSKQLVFNARARKYDSTLHASLDKTDVPVSVYHNLIDAVHNNMEYMYKYVRLFNFVTFASSFAISSIL